MWKKMTLAIRITGGHGPLISPTRRADVAKVMLDAVADSKTIGQRLLVTNPGMVKLAN
jgi:hypothetical protein